MHRSKSGAELTSPGFKFKRYAEVMVQLWRQARYEVSLPKGFEGVCNVGLEFDLWRDVGQRFLEHVRRCCPKIAIALWPGEQQQIDRWLNIGLIDLAFSNFGANMLPHFPATPHPASPSRLPTGQSIIC